MYVVYLKERSASLLMTLLEQYFIKWLVRLEVTMNYYTAAKLYGVR